jgi:hypothetical protein
MPASVNTFCATGSPLIITAPGAPASELMM